MSDEIKFRLQVMDEKIDKLVELNERQNDKLISHDVRLAKIETVMEVNTQELHEHKEGVIQNRAHIKHLELQMDNHEQTAQLNASLIKDELKPLLERETAKKYLRKWVLGAGAMAGAVYAILKLLGKV